MTAIQRTNSNSTVPSGVPSIRADLTSKSDLVRAFKGHDVVVNAVPNPELTGQKVVIDAAIEAGVKRIVPSEFSSNLEAEPTKRERLPNVEEKLKIREYVEQVAAQGKIEWSAINNGPFFDLGIQYGFLGPNVRTKKAVFHDGGDKPVCATSTFDIASAVAKMLQHPIETRNKPVYVYSAAITERQITSIVSRLTGIDFEIENIDVKAGARAYYGELEAGRDPRRDPKMMFNLYFLMMYAEGYGGDYRDSLAMNEVLGLRVMDERDIEEAVRGWLPKM